MTSISSPIKHDFLSLCIHHNILRFGEFKLKSGRVSPYFFNAGLFDNGELLTALSAGYADLIASILPNIGTEPMLYGPAYKGIPLAAATVMQLHSRHQINLPYAFNRKEAKDHGEGGVIVGAPLKGDIIVIDDVITAGTSINESAGIIKSAGARLAAVAIALDRQEVATGSQRSAVQEVEARLGCPVHSIVNLDDLIAHLQSHNDTGSDRTEFVAAVVAYRSEFGIHGEQS
ncbi:MAG: orotate phosphoribosyltransferase [Acidiferrobacterales bacterium]|nr:orotate phosphoribosyltransferase [Acidiferrobacterales bacterium]